MRIPLYNSVFTMILTSGKKLEANEFIFKVPKNFSKFQIKNYIENLYNIKTESIHTLNVRGKVKNSTKGLYKRPDYKKAYITVSMDENAKKMYNAFKRGEDRLRNEAIQAAALTSRAEVPVQSGENNVQEVKAL